jgi:hypothetical protein
MDNTVVSTSLIALLQTQQAVYNTASQDLGPVVGDFPVIGAMYRDINRAVTASRYPTPESTRYALQLCEEAQRRLIGLLDMLGFNNSSSKGAISRTRYKLRRFFKRHELEQARASYRSSVLLLRDNVMK